MEELILLQQTLNPTKPTLAKPYDSTVGVGAGFYWVSGLFLLFLVMGVAKAFWDDSSWNGKAYRFQGKKSKKAK